MVLEHVLEVHDVLVVQTLVNLDFGNEFLPRTVLAQTALGNDFGRLGLLGVHVGDLVALGEAALSEELAADVLANDLVTVGLVILFFDYNDRI